MNSVLITGASSKLSLPLQVELKNLFKEIFLITKNNSISTKLGAHYYADLTKTSELPIRCDCIVHLAACVPYNDENATNKDIIKTNSLIMSNLMKFAAKINAKKIIFVSSTDVYPLYNDLCVDESTPPNPHNLYGVSKLVCEHIGNTASMVSGIDFTTLRLGPIYSEKNPRINKISKMLVDLINHDELNIRNRLNEINLLHIDDAVKAILLSINGKPGLYNIAGRNSTVVDFFMKHKEIYNSKSQFNYSKCEEKLIKLNISSDKAYKDLNWMPTESYSSKNHKIR